jgi:hypothetical protein
MNIVVTLWDGCFDVTYECAGAKKCKHCLCEIMPAQDDEACCYRDSGSSCGLIKAQVAVLEVVKRRISAELKDKKNEEENNG